MRGFPSVDWAEDDNNYKRGDRMMRGFYSPDDNVIILLTPNIYSWSAFLYVLSHETFHWLTTYFIPDNLWDEANQKFDLICEFFVQLKNGIFQTRFST